MKLADGDPLSTSIIDTSLSNADLAPTTPAHRTWGTYNYIALWFSMSMEITTYQLASSLIAKGMDWKQAQSAHSTCATEGHTTTSMEWMAWPPIQD